MYAAIPFSEEQICNPSCSYVYGSGFEYWTAGNASATPTYINVGEACSPVCDTDYMDLDSSGNIWFSYYGCTSSSGGGLAEITNPTTNPKFVSILDPSTFQCPGGVYISNHGKMLNYVDECARTISQYTMPVTSSSQPANTLGPTPTNVFGAGQPSALDSTHTTKRLWRATPRAGSISARPRTTSGSPSPASTWAITYRAPRIRPRISNHQISSSEKAKRDPLD